ncbi:MAG: Beta-galactosidase C-terminal domain, partial [Alistipes sp.]|nr:Beta-galactosidase C-terminal domain [Alistipes sp.]
FYAAARMKEDGMRTILADMLTAAGVGFTKLPKGVERHERTADGERYGFYFNFSDEEAVLENVRGREILSQKELSGELRLAPLEAAVVMTERK